MKTLKKQVELSILRQAICEGRSIAEIAAAHNLPHTAVDHQLRMLREMAGAKNMAQLVATWFRKGLIK